MQIFLPDPQPLPPSSAEALGIFFNSDTCKVLRTIIRTRIAESQINLGVNITDSALGFLTAGALTEEARSHIQNISRLTIFLQVLKETELALKGRQITLTGNVTIDDE